MKARIEPGTPTRSAPASGQALTGASNVVPTAQWLMVGGHRLRTASLLAAALALLAAVPALAHARYERSEPGDGAIVSAPPQQVDIWFIQELFRREGENWIHVQDASGNRVDQGEALIDDDDRAHIWVELQTQLEPGTYLVTWHNLSAEDADSDEGEFSFSYDPQAAVTSTPMMAIAATAAPSLTPSQEPPAASTTTTAPPEVAATASPTEQPAGTGCGLGLLPIVGLALVALPLSIKRRAVP